MSDSTIAIIKPDAFKYCLVGRIITEIETSPLRIGTMKYNHLSSIEAWEEFYGEHRGKPFYTSLVHHMVSGPTIVMRLDAVNWLTPPCDAVREWRERMGPSDPFSRPAHTIRGKLAPRHEPQYENLVHGSDSDLSYHIELDILTYHGLL